MSKRYRLLTVREGGEAGLSEEISEKDATKLRRGLLLSATVDYSEDPKYPEITVTDGWYASGRRNGSGGSFSDERLMFESPEFIESTLSAQFVLEVTLGSSGGLGLNFRSYGGGLRVVLDFQSIGRFLYISSVKLWAAAAETSAFWTNFRKCKEVP